MLFVTIEMYHAPFYGWMHDLSAPDPLGILNAYLVLIKWNVPSILSFGQYWDYYQSLWALQCGLQQKLKSSSC